MDTPRRVRLASIPIDGTPTGDVLEQLLAPGALKTFEIAIPAATLSSPREGIDKNMHKALKVEAHPDIRFRLRSLEPGGSPAGASAKPGTAYRAFGWLTVAGVEKQVVLTLAVERKGSALVVTGGMTLRLPLTCAALLGATIVAAAAPQEPTISVLKSGGRSWWPHISTCPRRRPSSGTC